MQDWTTLNIIQIPNTTFFIDIFLFSSQKKTHPNPIWTPRIPPYIDV